VTFEEFMREEEEREKKRREAKLASEQKRLAEDTQRVKNEAIVKQIAQRNAQQLALRKRIMDEAHRTWVERGKKVYDLPQPPMVPVPWLVFDRATGDLLGEATTLRAYQAWAEVSPPQSFPACRCVLRSEWEAAEAEFRKKKMNGHSNGNGAIK
jgi:hypothetical protein